MVAANHNARHSHRALAGSHEELKQALRGPIAFPITPYRNDGSVDLDAVRFNSSWIGRSGVTAIVAPSGTGELPCLSPEECVAVLAETVEAVGGRVPVLGGVGFNAGIAADLARRAQKAKANGLMVMPPYYQDPEPAGLEEYYLAIARSCDLPLIAYARDSVFYTVDSLSHIAEAIPTLVAYKDGKGDVRAFQHLRYSVTDRIGRDRLVWLAGAGDDLVGAYFAAGAEGFTSSIAAFWPEAAIELYRLAVDGSREALCDFYAKKIRPIYELRYQHRGYEVSVMKAAMEYLGYAVGPARPPLRNLQSTHRERLGMLLAQLDIPTRAAREVR
jgi:5-dehydro-4-deoxyglucarate dehydratase